MTYIKEIKQAILKAKKAKTPDELFNILYPFIEQARPSPSCDEPEKWSPEEIKEHKNLKKVGRNRALELRTENPDLPAVPKENADIHEIVDWCISCKKAKKKRKPKDSVSADSKLMTALYEIFRSNSLCENKHPERPSIAYIAKLAGVGSKTPYKPSCANFLLNYKKTYPKPPRKGSKFNWGDGNRQDQSTYDPELDW